MATVYGVARGDLVPLIPKVGDITVVLISPSGAYVAAEATKYAWDGGERGALIWHLDDALKNHAGRRTPLT